MRTKIIRACDMLVVPTKLLRDPRLTLDAKGAAVALLTFDDRYYDTDSWGEFISVMENSGYKIEYLPDIVSKLLLRPLNKPITI